MQIQASSISKDSGNVYAKLVTAQDKQLLYMIKDKLKTMAKYLNNPKFDQNFDIIMESKNKTEALFAIGIKKDNPKHIITIYSVHQQYKLTRDLCKLNHIQQLFTCPHSNDAELQQFQRSLLSQLDSYKVVALGVKQNSVLKVNQKFMRCSHTAKL